MPRWFGDRCWGGWFILALDGSFMSNYELLKNKKDENSTIEIGIYFGIVV